jgi:hypothetical protein
VVKREHIDAEEVVLLEPPHVAEPTDVGRPRQRSLEWGYEPVGADEESLVIARDDRAHHLQNIFVGVCMKRLCF